MLFAYFLLRKDSLCCVNRCLNVPSVRPMYHLPVRSSLVVTCDLYMTLLERKLIVQWAYVLVLTVACLFLGHGGVCGSDLFVVLDDVFHVFQAAVAR